MAPATTDSQSATIQCEFCNAVFTSRNLFFRHLRDPSTPCGGDNKLERIPTAPSETKKIARQLHREEQHSRRGRKPTKKGQQNQHCVWVGDLPLPWTRQKQRYQRLRTLLRSHLPSCVPWIQHVQRKAYRSKKGDRPYLGYAIMAFRDAQECKDVIQALDGKDCRVEDIEIRERNGPDFPDNLPPFTLRAHPYVVRKYNGDTTTTTTSGGVDDKSPRGGGDNHDGPDPPLREQLRPLSTVDLLQRIALYDASSSQQVSTTLLSHVESLDRAVAIVGAQPRRYCSVAGKPLPPALRHRLWTVLSNLRWPVPNHRRHVQADRYMVLSWNNTATTDDELRLACRQLTDWAIGPSFACSAVAVTKNFIGSPHIDGCDRTFQYAVSLGEFEEGGELCVDGLNDDQQSVVYVVNTHNRIACVDGRYVHWVRPWKPAGRDRYSLIFYDTSDRSPTPVHPKGVIQMDSVDDGETCRVVHEG